MIRSIGSFMCAMLLLASIGCSSSGFLVVQDAPKGALPNQTLGLRAVVDTGSLSPTERYSWLELCDKVVSPVLKFWTSVEYRNCEPQVALTQVAQKTTTTGWVAGVVGPVIQTGMMAASVAYAGHEIGEGIGKSGSRTTNNNTGGNGNGTASSSNTNTNGNSNNANGGQGGQGGKSLSNSNAHGGNSNAQGGNSNAQGGQGGNGQGGLGGNGGQGGNGQGGLGGNGGQGGLGGNGGQGGGASATGCIHSGGNASGC